MHKPRTDVLSANYRERGKLKFCSDLNIAYCNKNIFFFLRNIRLQQEHFSIPKTYHTAPKPLFFHKNMSNGNENIFSC